MVDHPVSQEDTDSLIVSSFWVREDIEGIYPVSFEVLCNAAASGVSVHDSLNVAAVALNSCLGPVTLTSVVAIQNLHTRDFLEGGARQWVRSHR